MEEASSSYSLILSSLILPQRGPAPANWIYKQSPFVFSPISHWSQTPLKSCHLYFSKGQSPFTFPLDIPIAIRLPPFPVWWVYSSGSRQWQIGIENGWGTSSLHTPTFSSTSPSPAARSSSIRFRYYLSLYLIYCPFEKFQYRTFRISILSSTWGA